MTATVRVVLDQLVSPADADLAEASLETARALVRTAPSGCAVEAIVPSGAQTIQQSVPGIGTVRSAPLARRELIAAWQLGVAPGVGGGMIHSPTLAAPLVRHDRVNNGDQTIVTVWDLQAWEAVGELPRGAVAWNKGMLKRAAKFADAIIAPTYAIAERLDELAGVGDRVRVIPGAAAEGFRVPNDHVARTRDLSLPEHYVALEGSVDPSDGLEQALRGAAGAIEHDRHVVVFGAPVGQEPQIAELAAAAGIPERHVHVRPTLDAADRAALVGGGDAFIAATTRTAWPWRVIDALALGTPVIATDTATHREVVADGGALAAPTELAGAVAEAMDDLPRMRVLAGDRGRAYSWSSAAERIWQLHAEL